MTDTLFSDPTIDCDPNNFDINFNISSPYLSVKDFNNIRHVNHKLSILQLNARSLITNCDALQILLSTINSTFDIISICETWLINIIYNYIILKVIFLFIQLELISMVELLYYILIVNTKLIKLIIYHIVTHL